MMRATAVYRDLLCRRRYTYSVEPFNLLHWRSHLEAVDRMTDWEGPCGDLTATVMDCITSPHYDPVADLIDCARIIVSIDKGDTPDHIIGAVKTSDEGWMIVGDTTRPSYNRHALTHRPFEYNLLSEAGLKPVWRGGVPW